MITPLEIENKKFSKQMMNGYSVEEVDEFLDELTVCYEKLYKEKSENQDKLTELEGKLEHYKSIEGEDINNVAKQQADQLIKNAEADARQSLAALEQQITIKQRELEETQKQFDVYKAKMESLLISQLELIKDINKDQD